jgi:hypothetical protein
VCGLAACSFGAPLGSQCPYGDPRCAPQAAEPDDPEAHTRTSTPAAPLSLRVLDAEGRPLREAQLACGAACVEVAVAAEGGEPHYAYVWSDGSREPLHRLCADAAPESRVEVRDSAVPQASAQASLGVRVASCDAAAVSKPVGLGLCESQVFGLPNGCTTGTGVPGFRRLRPGERYSLRVHGMLSAVATVQALGVSINCVGASLPSMSLPAGPVDASLCVVLPDGVEWLSIGVVSSDLQVYLGGLTAEICTGCD